MHIQHSSFLGNASFGDFDMMIIMTNNIMDNLAGETKKEYSGKPEEKTTMAQLNQLQKIWFELQMRFYRLKRACIDSELTAQKLTGRFKFLCSSKSYDKFV
ncbi:unnamed protein product [Dicrocoelium dendriticum]|nr:unnamed protein product [Dicrocoelium dendriticum]